MRLISALGSVFPGGLGPVRRRLRRVVPPGVRGGFLRDGRDRGLHLLALLRESGRRGVRQGGERRGAVGVRRRAERALVRALVVLGCASRQPDDFGSAAGPSPHQLAPIVRRELSGRALESIKL